jgi:hypothetical protein
LSYVHFQINSVRRCNDRLVDDDTIDVNELSDSMLPNRAQFIHVANHKCRRPRRAATCSLKFHDKLGAPNLSFPKLVEALEDLLESTSCGSDGWRSHKIMAQFLQTRIKLTKSLAIRLS